MFDRSDQYHDQAQSKAEILARLRIVLPWPTLYETLRTRLVRNVVALARFEQFLKTHDIIYLDDSAFRNAAMELAMESSLRRRRPLSMVDCLIRLLIEDVNTRIDYLVTFNAWDFEDVCRTSGVELI
jgi:predicted nucleic acid-binding protein